MFERPVAPFRFAVRFSPAHALTMASAIALTMALVSTRAAAQSPDHDAAYQVVTRLFDAMRARDTTAMRSAFVPNASMQSLAATGVKFDVVDGWINGIGRAPAGLLLDERLANPVVHVDGDLASIWVDYWFYAGERFSHCGVDSFQLARQGGNWKIFSVVDTRRKEGCPPAPSRPA